MGTSGPDDPHPPSGPLVPFLRGAGSTRIRVSSTQTRTGGPIRDIFVTDEIISRKFDAYAARLEIVTKRVFHESGANGQRC